MKPYPTEADLSAAAKKGLYWNEARGCFLPCGLDGRNCAHVHQCPDLDQELPDEFEVAGLERLQEMDRSSDYVRSVEEIVEHLMPTEPPPQYETEVVAVKFDAAKLRYDLLPPDALAELVRVYGIGAVKYGAGNWENGMDWGRVYAALQRHANKWWAGERNDPEDGQHHLASVAWCALTLMAYEIRNAGTDTRHILEAL